MAMDLTTINSGTTTKRNMKPPLLLNLLLLAVFYLGTILGTSALSFQSHRCITVGHRRSVSYPKSQRDTSATKLFNAQLPTLPSSVHSTRPSARGPTGLRKIYLNIASNSFRRGGVNDTEIHKHDCKEKTSTNLLHSFALIATCRRLSFLILSMTLVNFVRSTILKIPKSNQKVFDACPWPFTLFHDPIQFVKDGATHSVFLWVLLCQIYSRYEKARLIIP